MFPDPQCLEPCFECSHLFLETVVTSLHHPADLSDQQFVVGWSGYDYRLESLQAAMLGSSPPSLSIEQIVDRSASTFRADEKLYRISLSNLENIFGKGFDVTLIKCLSEVVRVGFDVSHGYVAYIF